MGSLSLQFPLRSYTSSLRPITASSNGGVPLSRGARSGGGVGPAIVEIPLERIRRPLMRTRANDPAKVCELMDSIRQIGLQEPIDVLEVDGVYYGEELFYTGERKATR